MKLPFAKYGEMVLEEVSFYFFAVPDTDREACTVCHNAGFFINGIYIVCIDKDSAIDGQETGSIFRKVKKGS